MGRTALIYSIATLLLPFVSANFGFTNPSFEYVQLSTPQPLAWNGQSGLVSLRLMVYPADSELSYLPIAANLSGSSYTWVPDSLATGSKWTLEGIDADGNIASSLNPFTIQGGAGNAASGSNAASTSLMQQNPQTSQSSTFATSVSTPTSQATTTPTSSPTSTDAPVPSKDMPAGVKAAVFVGAVLGAAIIVALLTYIFLQRRRNKAKSLRRDSIELAKTGPYEVSELDGNASSATLNTLNSMNRPVVELKGSALSGSISTSMGERIELG